MRRRRCIPALVCALALTLPAGAVAQSAGDDQYQDPFSGQTQGSQGGGNSGGGGGGGGNAGSGNASQASPQTAQATPSSPGATAGQAQASAGQAQSSQGETLPRTGFPVLLPLAYGWVLLLTGAALRRVSGARPRIR